MAYVTSITTFAYQTRENSRFLSYPGNDKYFYPRVKSRISLSGVQENNFHPKVKSKISLSGVQELGHHQQSFLPQTSLVLSATGSLAKIGLISHIRTHK